MSSERLAVAESGYVRRDHVVTPWALSGLWVDSEGSVEGAVSKTLVKQPKVGFYEADFLVK